MASAVVRRALLYVPASSRKMLDKSRGLAAVDCVAYDLEDSVTPSKKPDARQNLQELLALPRAKGIREQAVRINAVESGLALDDLTAVLKAPNLDAIVVPKVQSASDLHFVTDVLRHTLPDRHPTTGTNTSGKEPIRVVALVESARALMDLSSICNASPYLSGLVFAAEDFALDLSIRRTPSLQEFLYARSAIVTACKAFNLPSAIDLVCTSFKGEQGLKTLEQECEGGKDLGFNGKQLIHPSQIEITQRVFSPVEKEVEWAARIVIGDKKAIEQGRGAWTMDGKMIDAPVVGKAQSILDKARACDYDVDAVMAKWKDQQPE